MRKDLEKRSYLSELGSREPVKKEPKALFSTEGEDDVLGKSKALKSPRTDLKSTGLNSLMSSFMSHKFQSGTKKKIKKRRQRRTKRKYNVKRHLKQIKFIYLFKTNVFNTEKNSEQILKTLKTLLQ